MYIHARECTKVIQKFPDWVDNEINDNHNKKQHKGL